MGTPRPEIAAIIARYCVLLEELGIHVEQAILYGSHARGEAKDGSDSNVLLGLKPRSFLKPCRHPTPGRVDPRTTGSGYIQPQYLEVFGGIQVRITTPPTRGVGACKAFVVTVPEM
jgi:hypothetical protein